MLINSYSALRILLAADERGTERDASEKRNDNPNAVRNYVQYNECPDRIVCRVTSPASNFHDEIEYCF